MGFHAESGLRVPADVLHALGELRVEVLAADRVAQDHPLAARRQSRDELALELDPSGGAVVGAGDEPTVERVHGLAARGVARGAGVEQVGVKPTILEPRRAEPAAQAQAMSGQQAFCVDFLDGGVPVLGAPGRRLHEPLGQRTLGLDPQRHARSTRCGGIGLPRGLSQVEVLEVVHVVGRDGVRMRHVEARSCAETLGGAARGLAAALAAGRDRGGRIEGHDQIAAQRLDGLDIARRAATREGVGADISMDLGALELRRRHRGRQRFEPDLLGVVAGIERQLVSGPGGNGPEQAEEDKDEPAPDGRISMRPRTSHEREKGGGGRFPSPSPEPVSRDARA